MKSTIRTFIGINIIPEKELITLLEEAKSTFSGELIKWVDENNFHLTLRFLGETTNIQVHEIIQSLEKIADRTESFSIKLMGVNYFIKNREPKVLFINIEESVNLKNLADLTENEVSNTGFELNNSVFNPHLTLGRIKFMRNINRFKAFVDNWKEHEFQTIQVKEIIYYQSILSSNGSIYKPIQKFELL